MLRVEIEATRGDFNIALAVAVPPGECLALAGPSGAGKTTALRVAAGLLRPDSGRVSCGDEIWLDTDRGLDLPPERRRCGYVFQDYALFPHLSAWQNVAYGFRDVARRRRHERAVELLERFGVGHVADARPGSLSGGERQRVAVARSLARRPATLLLDEPLSALDARTRARATRELASTIDRLDVPTLLVTHDFSEAAMFADRVAVIDGGRIVQEGRASELAAQPRSAFVADFTGAVVLSGTARGGAGGLTSVDLDGGGQVLTTDAGAGRVALSVYPWEIAIEPPDAERAGSAQNRLPAEIVSLTAVGNRVRLGLSTPQPLAADITETSARELGLERGAKVTATWKAAATRLMAG